MREHLLPAVRIASATLLLTGLAYPLAVTGVARVLFPHASGGSLVRGGEGGAVGSELVGQRFGRPGYFQPRPSAAGADGWDGRASGGSNLGPISARLRARAAAERDRLAGENPDAGPVPEELVTASGSGLDPHVSPAAARWQAPRVARARGVPVERVLALVHAEEEGRDLGFLGEPRVNVLLLNLALDRRLGAPGGASSAGAAAR